MASVGLSYLFRDSYDLHTVREFWLAMVYDHYGLTSNVYVLLSFLSIHAVRVAQIPDGERKR